MKIYHLWNLDLFLIVIKISFELWGLSLLEPMALILNWVIALQTLIYFFKLKTSEQNDLVKYWRGFFLFFSISAFFGGFSHLFFNYWGLAGKIPGWITGIIAISSAEWAITAFRKTEKKKKYQYFILAKFCSTITLFIIDFSFTWVIVHSTIGFLFLILLPTATGYFKGEQHLRYFSFGILLLLIALPIRIMELDIHLWFNRDDFAHILMFGAIYCFHRGVIETTESTIEVSTADSVLG